MYKKDSNTHFWKSSKIWKIKPPLKQKNKDRRTREHLIESEADR